MGQRGGQKPAVTVELLSISVFATPLGQWSLVGTGQQLWGISRGHGTADSARAVFGSAFQGVPIAPEVTDWFPKLRQLLERYSRGERVSFTDIAVHFPPMTEFQTRVIEATRKIPYGKTISYGELATEAGFPRAARAVGSVMANNKFPVIIPCHRVVASNGLGGYSGPHGISFKQQLLELEGGDDPKV